MSSFYKYMKLSRLQDALEYGVHASKFEEVNDPFEGECIENPDHYRIACMTASPKKMLLWSYYVKHRGCCVEFDIPDEYKGVIEKITYDEDFIDRSEMDIQEILEALKHKGKEWELENEYRAIYYEPEMNASPLWVDKNNSGTIFLRLPVKSVCFGVNSQKEDDYVKSLEQLLDYKKIWGKEVGIKKLKKSNKKYELVFDGQFDVETEIKKYKKK